MPDYKAVGGVLAGSALPVLGLGEAFDLTHLSQAESAAVVALWVATAALIAFVYEHLRSDTPPRWVGVLGMIPPEVTGILGVLFVFHAITGVQGAAIMAVVAVPLGILFPSISQELVWSKPSMEAEVSVAQAAALRGPAADEVKPPV